MLRSSDAVIQACHQCCYCCNVLICVAQWRFCFWKCYPAMAHFATTHIIFGCLRSTFFSNTHSALCCWIGVTRWARLESYCMLLQICKIMDMTSVSKGRPRARCTWLLKLLHQALLALILPGMFRECVGEGAIPKVAVWVKYGALQASSMCGNTA